MVTTPARAGSPRPGLAVPALKGVAWWVAVAAVVGAVAVTQGVALTGALLPALKASFQAWLPGGFVIDRFEIGRHGGQAALLGDVHLHTLLSIGRRVINESGHVAIRLTLGGVLEPLIVVAATAAAWPLRWPWRVAAALAGVIAGVVLLVGLAPAQMAGMVMQKYYVAFASDQVRPFIIRVPRFLEAGGRTMLAVVAGLATAAVVAAIARWRAERA